MSSNVSPLPSPNSNLSPPYPPHPPNPPPPSAPHPPPHLQGGGRGEHVHLGSRRCGTRPTVHRWPLRHDAHRRADPPAPPLGRRRSLPSGSSTLRADDPHNAPSVRTPVPAWRSDGSRRRGQHDRACSLPSHPRLHLQHSRPFRVLCGRERNGCALRCARSLPTVLRAPVDRP